MRIVFYEKPGCGNNTRQKQMLAAAGHEIIARDILCEPWTAQRLLEFFGKRPVADWFNRASPRIKSSEIKPETLSVDAAIGLMLSDPLLIRRPLIEAMGRREAGFDLKIIGPWLGVETEYIADECLHPPGKTCARAESP